MKINSLYKDKNNINIDSYLKLHGIDNPEMYLDPSKYNGSPLIVEDFKYYKNIDKGIELIKKYVNSHIYMIVDCDADGYTSAAELYLYLKKINEDIKIEYLIHEFKLHGLNDSHMYEYLKTQEPSLLIIPDANGSEEEYAELHDLEFEILVLDHHETSDSKYATVVNCKINNEVLNNGASGSIVVHQFLRALDYALGVKYAGNFIDLAVCGCIGDVMPLNNYYNRTYFYYGTRFIKNKFLETLFNTFVKTITPHNISFGLIPKINSVVRSSDYGLKVRMFEAFVGIADCEEVANECKKCHERQRVNVKKISEQLYDTINIDDKVIIAECNDMIPSYSGLIAGKISGDLNKPCVVVKKNDHGYTGSMRSPVPVRELFEKSDAVTWCKGHNVSAGILINNLDRFKLYCSELELTTDNIDDVTYAFNDVYKIPKNLFGYFSKYEELWGEGIEKPRFYIGNIHINSKDINLLGRSKTTMKFRYKGVDFLIFYASGRVKSDFFLDLDTELSVNVIGDLNLNIWKNEGFSQVIIEKYEVRKSGSLSFEDVY